MFRVTSIGRFLLVGAAAAMVATACGDSSTVAEVGSGNITGAGATFPQPFYGKAFADYMGKYPQVQINYQPIGSGGGIKAFQANTVQFGASDVPMGSADITTAGGPDALTQIPTTLGVISIAFNLSNVTSLNLDGATLASIFLGHIKNWKDPAIAALNSSTTFPNKSITVVHRSDSSGTTFHFTDYLSKVSPEFASTILAGKGPAKLVNWPSGEHGDSGNQAVAQEITATDGAIGYVELAYVVQTGMTQAAIKNVNGKFVKASVAGATAAAAQNTSVSPTNFSITDQPGDTTYPIAAFSWAILRTSYTDANQGKGVVQLFDWLVTAGQKEGVDLQYAPLPPAVQDLALSNLKLIKAAGTPVLS